MADVESALARLETALDRAEKVVANGGAKRSGEVEALQSERDRLAEEVAELRAAAEEDARLRAEAADAVKSALSDLRGLVREDANA